MTKKILEAVAISKSFETPILSNVNFSVKEAETHVIMGKSGEGKSTFLKILAGLVSSDKGKVLFLGEKVDNPEEVLVAGHEELAYVAQNFNLLHNRTVLENLKDALLAFKDDFANQQIEQLLQLMRLESIKSQKIEQLSGGEKQRLAIARALATEPAVLLLDEPFTQLDFLTRQILLDAIKEVRRELDTSVILVSHNLYEAFYLADFVHVLHEGSFIKSDSPYEIYKNPEYLAVANLLGQVNVIPSKMLEGRKDSLMGIWSEHILIEPNKKSSTDHQFQLKLVDELFLGGYYLCRFQFSENSSLVVKSKKANYRVGESYTIVVPQQYLFELREH